MTDSNPQRTFVKPDDTAAITCPACQLTKTIAVGKFRSTRHTISVRCTCGHSFPVALDFRRHYRKKTTLPGIFDTADLELDTIKWKKSRLTGVYTLQAPATGDGHMKVTNISLGGLQFVTPDDHAIEVGQKARVAFTLDDRHQTEIIKNVIIQSVNDHVIGCQFAEGETLEQGLRFYLFP
jgi:hypothetical protein